MQAEPLRPPRHLLFLTDALQYLCLFAQFRREERAARIPCIGSPLRAADATCRYRGWFWALFWGIRTEAFRAASFPIILLSLSEGHRPSRGTFRLCRLVSYAFRFYLRGNFVAELQ